MKNHLYFLFVALVLFSIPKLGRADAKHTIIRVGLERGVVYTFKESLAELLSIDSHNVIEIRNFQAAANKKLIIGRKLGSAQFLIRYPNSEDYQSFVVRVLPDDSDLSEPDYDVPVGGTIRIKFESTIASVVASGDAIAVGGSATEQDVLFVTGKKAGRSKLQAKTSAGETRTYTVEVYVPFVENDPKE